MSLYNKYRPSCFDEIIGNENVVAPLKSLLKKKEIPHAFLLHGESGCGKTTVGRIIATELGCKGNDYREIDSADFRGIDSVREIRKQSHYKPLEGKCRVWLLDECHQLSKDAQNALLKALEDTPKHVYYILCTTDPQKLLPTIKGRCSQHQVSTLTDEEMQELLKKVVAEEGETVKKGVYEQIIQDSQGHPRNALQILEKVISVPEDKRIEIAKHAAEIQSQTIELCRALVQKSPWKKMKDILSGLKDQDPEQMRRAVLGYCSSILLKGENNQAAFIMEEFIRPFYDSGFPGLVLACYSVICSD